MTNLLYQSESSIPCSSERNWDRMSLVHVCRGKKSWVCGVLGMWRSHLLFEDRVDESHKSEVDMTDSIYKYIFMYAAQNG